jgi:hypothetical protein
MGRGGQSEAGRMSKFQIIIRKFWIRVEKPIWSFIVNCVFWLGHLNEIGEIREIKDSLKYINIETLMQRFLWKKDNLADWTPWVYTIIYQDFTDDCDGAAELAKWHFKTKGIKADILNLYNQNEGHTICVTKDRTKMVSNENVVSLNPAIWEAEIMQYFNNEYEVII